MHARSNVAPDTLAVDLGEDGVVVEYLDGREAFYHGVPETVERSVRTAPGKHVHVLVTDPDGVEGVLTYVNDQTTHDDVLESTGVGRVFLEPGEREELFPGVVVRMDGLAAVVEADLEVVDGRVFVFEEDPFGERSFEVVPKTDSDGEDGEVPSATDAGASGGADGDGEATSEDH